MAGTFSPGDLLRVERVEQPRVGDVVVYERETGAHIVHRVHAVLEGGLLVTKGDAAERADDAPVPYARVRGRVAGVLPLPSAERSLLYRVGARLFGPLYRRAARQTGLRRRLRALLRLDFEQLHLRTPSGGELIKILHRGRTVAWLYPDTGQIRSRFPYALVVDPPPFPPAQPESPATIAHAAPSVSTGLSPVTLLAVESFNPELTDGVSRTMFEILHLLERRGHPARALAFLGDDSFRRRLCADHRRNGVEVRCRLLPMAPDALAARRDDVVALVRRCLPRSLEGRVLTSDDDVAALVFCEGLGWPGTHFVHSVAAVEGLRRAPIALAALRSRRLVVPSAFLRGVVHERLGLEAEVWPPLLRPEVFVPERAARGPGLRTVGYYSGGRHKGDDVVRALAVRRPELRFVVAGRGFVAALPPLANLEWRGDIRDMREFFRDVDLLLAPSLVEEGFGRVLLEAALCGLPVVANRVGGIPEALGNGGVLIDVPADAVVESLSEEYLRHVDRLLQPDAHALTSRSALEWGARCLERQRAVERRIGEAFGAPLAEDRRAPAARLEPGLDAPVAQVDD